MGREWTAFERISENFFKEIKQARNLEIDRGRQHGREQEMSEYVSAQVSE